VLTIKHLLVAIQNWITVQIAIFGFYSKSSRDEFVRLGSDYGGWWLPKDAISNNNSLKVAISAGLGFDVTFDKALLQSGFEVIGLDPLEECIDHANSSLQGFDGFSSLRKGLWETTGIQNFFPPKISTHDSWSVRNIQNSSVSRIKSFEVISLEDLFAMYPKLRESDYRILKMDIEGSELEVMKSLLTFNHKFDFIGIEIDFLSLIPFLQIRNRLKMIRNARLLLKEFNSIGYRLVKTENFNFFWIQTNHNI
jgi:FkbM family methyltransferase